MSKSDSPKLLFSGPTAFLSNMGRSEFVFDNQPYTSAEQGIQHQNAMHHSATEIAAKIMGTDEAKYIKTLSHDIPKSDTWKKLSPGKLWELMEVQNTKKWFGMEHAVDFQRLVCCDKCYRIYPDDETMCCKDCWVKILPRYCYGEVVKDGCENL